MVDLPSQPLGNIDPEFQKIALETGELTYGLSGTSTREKLLLNLANDVCREHLGLAFRLHIQAALSHGVPFADLLGVVRFIGPYAGYPAGADALERLVPVKGRHDPTNLFRLNQNIPPSSETRTTEQKKKSGG